MPSSNDPVTAAVARLLAVGDAVVVLAVVAVANLEPAVHGTSASHGQVAAAPRSAGRGVHTHTRCSQTRGQAGGEEGGDGGGRGVTCWALPSALGD